MVPYWVANQGTLIKIQLSTSLMPKTNLNNDFGPKQTQHK
jgi:hypothetical protein